MRSRKMLAIKKTEKVTFNLPSDIKEEVIKLKEAMNISLNTIYKTAILEYLQKQEIKKWEEGAKKASKNKEYRDLCEELGDTGGELYEY